MTSTPSTDGCTHPKLAEHIHPEMGSFPATWTCEDCRLVVPITWTPSWPRKQKPSEWIRQKIEQLRPGWDCGRDGLSAETIAILDYLDQHHA